MTNLIEVEPYSDEDAVKHNVAIIIIGILSARGKNQKKS